MRSRDRMCNRDWTEKGYRFMQLITVAVVDWDRTECAACERLLRREQGISVVAPTATSEGVVAAALRVKPRILLCSLGLAVASGCSLLLTLRRDCPETLVVLLTDSTIHEDRLMLALASGAVGFLTRETLRFQLLRAIRGVNEGEAWVSRKMLGSMFDRVFTPARAEPDINGMSRQ
jgi:DNA-binding NarL/FixJ family response regulator